MSQQAPKTDQTPEAALRDRQRRDREFNSVLPWCPTLSITLWPDGQFGLVLQAGHHVPQASWASQDASSTLAQVEQFLAQDPSTDIKKIAARLLAFSFGAGQQL